MPPEINSGRMYAGPGPGSMLAAAAAWQSLAEELTSAASGYGSIVSTLTSGSWTGPSSISMAAAATPYVTWLSATGDQAQLAATQAAAAASAYESAFAATVPPPIIEANRSLLAALVATNVLGQNTPAIAATEALYAEMWAQDATAMYGYAGASATASQVTPFTAPPQTTNSSGLMSQSVAAAQSAGTSGGTDLDTIMSSGPQVISGMPQALQSLASPQALDGVASTATGTSTSSTSATSIMNELSTPLKLASMPMSMLSKLFTAGSTATAAKAATTAANELGAATRGRTHVEYRRPGLGRHRRRRLGRSGTLRGYGSGHVGRRADGAVCLDRCGAAGDRRRNGDAPRWQPGHLGGAGRYAIGHAADDADRQHGRTRGCG